MVLNTSVYNKFRDAFEIRCFRLIIEAYYSSVNDNIIKSDWNENDISSEIHKHLTENPLRKKWHVSSNVEIHIPKDTPKKDKGYADKFPRIDFKLTTFSKEEEYEYFVEAKNLKQNSSALKRRYINTGINSFVYKKYPNGSLIGYLLEGNINDTIAGINSLLAKDKRNTEALNFKPHKLIDSYYESYHYEIGTLKHLIFDFTNR